MPAQHKPKPFLDASRRDWQLATCAWLLRNSGGYGKFMETTLVLPIEAHFPDRGMNGAAAVAALFRRVRDHAGMADWPCAVEPEAESPCAIIADPDGIPIFRYGRGELEPAPLVATFARELARYFVGTFEEPAPGGKALLEPAADLAAVFMGFGVFMANSAVRNPGFHLNEGELVHALAMFCLLRKLPPESIDRHLNPHVRKYLRLAARDLAQHEIEFRRLRAVPSAAIVEFADATLPTASNRNL